MPEGFTAAGGLVAGLDWARRVLTAAEIGKLAISLFDGSGDEKHLSGLLAIHEVATKGGFDLLEHIPKDVAASAERVSSLVEKITQAEHERDAIYASFLNPSGLEKQLQDKLDILNAGNDNLRPALE